MPLSTEDVIAVIADYASGARLQHSYCGFARGASWQLTIAGDRGSLQYDTIASPMDADALALRLSLGHTLVGRGKYAEAEELLRAVIFEPPPEDEQARQGYDYLAESFGPGGPGPIQVIVPAGGDTDAVAATVSGTEGIAMAFPGDVGAAGTEPVPSSYSG